MNWLALCIGGLVALSAKWFIDLCYWRRAYHSLRKENEVLKARLYFSDGVLERVCGHIDRGGTGTPCESIPNADDTFTFSDVEWARSCRDSSTHPQCGSNEAEAREGPLSFLERYCP